MKRLLRVFLALLLICAVGVCDAAAEEKTISAPMDGAFFSSLWGGTPADAMARRLLNGLSPVYWDEAQLRYGINESVVSQIIASDLPDGSREYCIRFNQGLRFSDGSPVTARDYAFTLLLLASPQMDELGTEGSAYSYLMGWDKYHSGKTDVFAGVNLPGELELKLTLSNDCLPCFFETGLLSVTPFPVSALFPELDVNDIGDGAYIASNEASPEGGFTVQSLRNVLLDPLTGYLSRPIVSSGEYCFVSYDGETLTLAENPFSASPALPSSPLPEVYTCLSFACERKTLVSASVRKAIALCLDMDGLLAVSQAASNDEVNGFHADPANQLAWPYASDLSQAIQLLEEDGWTVNEDGEAYTGVNDGTRCKLVGGAPVRLSLILSYTDDGTIDEEALDTLLVRQLALAGIELTLQPLSAADLDQLVRSPGRRLSDLMLTDVEIYPDSDLSAFFKPGGQDNIFGVSDEELYLTAFDVFHSAEGDSETYFAKLKLFQERFFEVLPAIPLHAAEYPY